MTLSPAMLFEMALLGCAAFFVFGKWSMLLHPRSWAAAWIDFAVLVLFVANALCFAYLIFHHL